MTGDPDDENEDIASYFRKLSEKQRGVSDFFDCSDKSTTELEVARTAFEEAGIAISELRAELDDPPDCVALLDQELIGIEVTEFVGEDIIKRNKRDGTRLWRAWSKEAFLTKLDDIVAKKDRKELKGGPYSKYYLVVHTDEDSLTAEMVRPWLAGYAPAVGLLDEVLLLFSYDPETKRYPLFRIPVQKK